MSMHSDRARRRAAKVRQQRIILIVLAGIVVVFLAFFAIRAFLPKGSESSEMTTSPSGLQYQDLIVGNGDEAVIGNTVSVHYIGTLEDGTKFDSSYDRGTPFQFTIGTGMVIPGWEEGVLGMKEGGKRRLVIPPAMAYGETGVPGVIPANATLVFEIELLDIQ
jgi:FKBP-type peptidyl-prolyl cis-trans isomerase